MSYVSFSKKGLMLMGFNLGRLNIQEFYMKTFGKPATADILRHMKRELAHAAYHACVHSWLGFSAH